LRKKKKGNADFNGKTCKYLKINKNAFRYLGQVVLPHDFNAFQGAEYYS